MRRAAGLTFLFAIVLPGCNIAYYAGHNLVNEVALKCGEHSLRKRVRAEAATAWEMNRGCLPRCPWPGAYADGFVDGYSDYIIDGGPVHTPTAAPPEYRRHAQAFTRAGRETQECYLNGFRHGMEVAAANGGRECTLVPVVLPVAGPDPPLPINCENAPTGGKPAAPLPEVKIPLPPMPVVLPPPVPVGPPEPEPLKKP